MKKELICFTILIALASFLRFFQLGYSNFYPDETKVFHMRKDIAITDFLLNQRKGPIQFVVAWGAEKLFGGYNELYTRIPFALAGVLAIGVFYILVKKLFGKKAALLAGCLFCLNGFFIAFGRTVQYQSFIFLFSFTALLATLCYTKNNSGKKARIWLATAAVFLALSFLAHWDAIFVGIVITFILTKALIQKQKNIKELLVFFVIPFLAILSIFFIPYFTRGYFAKYTIDYIENRVTGAKTSPNNSFTTFELYNPYKIGASIIFFGVLALAVLAVKDKKDFLENKVLLIAIWFIFPFILFEIVFKSPGTHILNYIIPLIILTAYSFAYIDNRSHGSIRMLFRGIVICSLGIYGIFQTETFIPKFNKGYPWNKAINRDQVQLFLYGFPYNRGWGQIRDYFKKNSIHNYYTNDNIVLSQYYLYGVYTKPVESIPEYYIYVYANHQFSQEREEMLKDYILKETIYQEGKPTAEIYKVNK